MIGGRLTLEVSIPANIVNLVNLCNNHRKDGIGDHPHDDDIRPNSAVVILLDLFFGDRLFLDFETITEVSECLVVSAIDI